MNKVRKKIISATTESQMIGKVPDVIDRINWNNKNIVVQKQSPFRKHLFCQGIVKIEDLLSNTGKFLQSSNVLTAYLSPNQYFKLIVSTFLFIIPRR